MADVPESENSSLSNSNSNSNSSNSNSNSSNSNSNSSNSNSNSSNSNSNSSNSNSSSNNESSPDTLPPVRRKFKLPELPDPLEPEITTSEQLNEFYKKRAKKPDIYGYDGTGNLVIRNKDGSIEQTLGLPKYRALTVEEITEQEEIRRQAISNSVNEYESKMAELRSVIMDYRVGAALASAVKDAQLEVERADEARTNAQMPNFGVRIIDNLVANKLFPENKYDKRVLDYKIYKVVGRSTEIKKSYVKGVTQAEEAEEQRAAEEAEAAAADELEVDVGFAEPVAKSRSNILILFNHPDDNDYGWLSNEYPVEYSWNGVRYFTVDQALAAAKARYYGNMDVLQKIMKTRSATTMRAEARKLGLPTQEETNSAEAAGAAAAVQAQKEVQWTQEKRKVLLSVLLAKFRQHVALGRKLLETGDAQIAYAESRNTEEGIGLGLADTRAGTPSKWRGKNTLGEALMQVRTQLRGGAAEVTGAEASVQVAGPQAATAEEAAAADAQRAAVGSIIARRKKPTLPGPG